MTTAQAYQAIYEVLGPESGADEDLVEAVRIIGRALNISGRNA